MSFLTACQAALIVATCSLCGCSGLLNPRPPPEPDRWSLSERRAEMQSLVTDPDPAPLSAWPGAVAPQTSQTPPAQAAAKRSDGRVKSSPQPPLLGSP